MNFPPVFKSPVAFTSQNTAVVREDRCDRVFVLCIAAGLALCIFHLWWIFFLFRGNRDFGVLFKTYPASWILTDAMMLLAFFLMRRRIARKAAS